MMPNKMLYFPDEIWTDARPAISKVPEGKYQFLVKDIGRTGVVKKTAVTWMVLRLQITGIFVPAMKGKIINWIINDRLISVLTSTGEEKQLPNANLSDLGFLFSSRKARYLSLRSFIQDWVIGKKFTGQLDYYETKNDSKKFQNARIIIDRVESQNDLRATELQAEAEAKKVAAQTQEKVNVNKPAVDSAEFFEGE